MLLIEYKQITMMIIIAVTAIVGLFSIVDFTPENHVRPSLTMYGIDTRLPPAEPGLNMVFPIWKTFGTPMSTIIDEDKKKVTVPISNMPIEFEVVCVNQLISENAAKMAKLHGYNWDRPCVQDASAIALTRAIDKLNVTIKDLEEKDPINQRMMTEIFNHTEAIGCNPGEWYKIHSCSILQAKFPESIRKGHEALLEEDQKGSVLNQKRKNAEIEQDTKSFVQQEENKRKVSEAETEAMAATLKYDAELNYTVKKNEAHEKYLNNTKIILGDSFNTERFSQAITDGANAFTIFGENEINLHTHK